MPTQPVPWGERILQVLADGEWHPREELIRAAMETIPPGVAYRRGERDRCRQLSGADRPATRVQGDETTSIASGARIIATETLKSKVTRGRVTRDGDQYRIADPAPQQAPR